MSLFLLHKDTCGLFTVIGELIESRLVYENNKHHVKILFSDIDVFNFIKEWVKSESNTPVDECEYREIYIYYYLEGNLFALSSSSNPIILKGEKDWFDGYPVIDNIAKIDYTRIGDVDSHVSILPIVKSWIRDRKIKEILE